MKTASMSGWLVALVVMSGLVGLRIVEPWAQTEKKPTPVSMTPVSKPMSVSPVGGSDRGAARQPTPVLTPADADRRSQIKEIDAKIKSLRDDYKAQIEPLQAQLKALKDKLDADLKPLEDQRKALIEQGESPGLIALDQDESNQLASLADQEKAEIEKVRQRYEDQRKQIRQDFEKWRQELAHK